MNNNNIFDEILEEIIIKFGDLNTFLLSTFGCQIIYMIANKTILKGGFDLTTLILLGLFGVPFLYGAVMTIFVGIRLENKYGHIIHNSSNTSIILAIANVLALIVLYTFF